MIAFNDRDEFLNLSQTMAKINAIDIGNPHTGVMAVIHSATIVTEAPCVKDSRQQ